MRSAAKSPATRAVYKTWKILGILKRGAAWGVGGGGGGGGGGGTGNGNLGKSSQR